MVRWTVIAGRRSCLHPASPTRPRSTPPGSAGRVAQRRPRRPARGGRCPRCRGVRCPGRPAAADEHVVDRTSGGSSARRAAPLAGQVGCQPASASRRRRGSRRRPGPARRVVGGGVEVADHQVGSSARPGEEPRGRGASRPGRPARRVHGEQRASADVDQPRLVVVSTGVGSERCRGGPWCPATVQPGPPTGTGTARRARPSIAVEQPAVISSSTRTSTSCRGRLAPAAGVAAALVEVGRHHPERRAPAAPAGLSPVSCGATHQPCSTRPASASTAARPQRAAGAARRRRREQHQHATA